MLTNEEKIKILEFWYETHSYVLVRRKFIIEFGLVGRKKATAPSDSVIKLVVENFKKNGSVQPQRKGINSKNHVRTPEKIEEVRESVTKSPGASLRRRSLKLGIPKTTTARILKDDLKMFPYRITTHHLLSNDDVTRRLAMCKWFSTKMEEEPDWINNVWFSDEAHFHLNGAVNNHNNRFWGTERPDQVAPKNLKGPKVTAWCALNAKYGVIGPYWFEENGRTVTVNAARYRKLIDRFGRALKRKVSDDDSKKVVFMQDGATPHTSNETVEHLYSVFGDDYNLIGKKLDIEWAPHSPDLNPLDFFFWGAAKNEVYKISSEDLADLKKAVTSFARSVTVLECKKVIDNFAVRINACKNRKGCHYEHVDYYACA